MSHKQYSITLRGTTEAVSTHRQTFYYDLRTLLPPESEYKLFKVRSSFDLMTQESSIHDSILVSLSVIDPYNKAFPETGKTLLGIAQPLQTDSITTEDGGYKYLFSYSDCMERMITYQSLGSGSFTIEIESRTGINLIDNSPFLLDMTFVPV